MKAMVAGKKVRQFEWDKDTFIYLNDDKTIILDNNNKPYHFYSSVNFDSDYWEEYYKVEWNVGLGDKIMIENHIHLIVYVDNKVAFLKDLERTGSRYNLEGSDYNYCWFDRKLINHLSPLKD